MISTSRNEGVGARRLVLAGLERTRKQREKPRETEKLHGNHRWNWWSRTWWLLAIAMEFEQWSSWRFSHRVLEKDLIEERKEESSFEI